MVSSVLVNGLGRPGGVNAAGDNAGGWPAVPKVALLVSASLVALLPTILRYGLDIELWADQNEAYVNGGGLLSLRPGRRLDCC